MRWGKSFQRFVKNKKKGFALRWGGGGTRDRGPRTSPINKVIR